jgi:chlorite dismutase
MTKTSDEQQLDLSEKGRMKDGTVISLDRRLFFQFFAFGNCLEINTIAKFLRKSNIDGVLYIDINDPHGIGFLTMNENPSYFVTTLREILNEEPFKNLSIKDEFTMFGRTYSFGYETNLQETLLSGPKKKVLDPDWRWAIWYPLRRKKNFESLPEDEKRAILGEHGKLGFKFGKAGYAKDIRLSCHGIDKNDNDFVIGVIGKKLHPLSACIEAMRKTRQTSEYLESLGPFFVGRAVWQSKI